MQCAFKCKSIHIVTITMLLFFVMQCINYLCNESIISFGNNFPLEVHRKCDYKFSSVQNLQILHSRSDCFYNMRHVKKRECLMSCKVGTAMINQKLLTWAIIAWNKNSKFIKGPVCRSVNLFHSACA